MQNENYKLQAPISNNWRQEYIFYIQPKELVPINDSARRVASFFKIKITVWLLVGWDKKKNRSGGN